MVGLCARVIRVLPRRRAGADGGPADQPATRVARYLRDHRQ